MSPPSHPKRLWLAAAIVALCEIFVVGLALSPNVGDDYRAYFIDHTSDCWPHTTPADYTLGETLSFVVGKGHSFVPNKICGWFYPNAHGTWSYGGYSLLRFKFTPPGTPLTLTVAAGAMVTPTDPAQRVTVSIGAAPLGTLLFDSELAEVKSLVIPPEIAAGSAAGLELRFGYPDARPGDELGPNEDPHLRAIRMVALTLSASPEP